MFKLGAAVSLVGLLLAAFILSAAPNSAATTPEPQTPSAEHTAEATAEVVGADEAPSRSPLLTDTFLADTSLVENDPCVAPCWRGITVGETSWDDAIGILENDAQLSDLEMDLNELTGEIVLTFRQIDGDPCCLIYTKDGDKVDQILLQLAPDNTLGDVIGNLGAPSYFNGTEIDPSQAAASLYYPDRQLIVYAFVEGANRGVITEKSEIFAALYMTVEDMQTLIETTSLIAWHGYNSYRGYLSQPFAVTPVATAVQ